MNESELAIFCNLQPEICVDNAFQLCISELLEVLTYYIPEIHFCSYPCTDTLLASLESTQGELEKEITAHKLAKSQDFRTTSEPLALALHDHATHLKSATPTCSML